MENFHFKIVQFAIFIVQPSYCLFRKPYLLLIQTKIPLAVLQVLIIVHMDLILETTYTHTELYISEHSK